MITINTTLMAIRLKRKLGRFWDLFAEKILRIERDYDESKGARVIRQRSKYERS